MDSHDPCTQGVPNPTHILSDLYICDVLDHESTDKIGHFTEGNFDINYGKTFLTIEKVVVRCSGVESVIASDSNQQRAAITNTTIPPVLLDTQPLLLPLCGDRFDICTDKYMDYIANQLSTERVFGILAPASTGAEESPWGCSQTHVSHDLGITQGHAVVKPEPPSTHEFSCSGIFEISIDSRDQFPMMPKYIRHNGMPGQVWHVEPGGMTDVESYLPFSRVTITKPNDIALSILSEQPWNKMVDRLAGATYIDEVHLQVHASEMSHLLINLKNVIANAQILKMVSFRVLMVSFMVLTSVKRLARTSLSEELYEGNEFF